MKFKLSKIFLTLFIACFSILSINIVQANAAQTAPDYGIYWFGQGNVSQKFVNGEANKYFDPTKPTVIFVHGWEMNSQPSNKRPNFNCTDENGNTVNIVDGWIKKGWNVGLFYWDAFSDETFVTDAEAKIWNNNGPKKMRWRDNNGDYHDSSYKNAGELFFDTYVQAMNGYKGNNIRIAGHSLGNQMATYLTKRVYDAAAAGQISNNIKPNRLALLDPYWSNFAKDYLNNKWTGEVCREYVKDLKSKGAAIELYRSTLIDQAGTGDENKEELNSVAFACYKPWFKAAYDIGGKHSSAINMYFLSYNSKAPVIYTKDSSGNYTQVYGYAPSAAVSDSDIKKFMNGEYRYDQYTGVYTLSTEDDGYAQVKRSDAYVLPKN